MKQSLPILGIAIAWSCLSAGALAAQNQAFNHHSPFVAGAHRAPSTADAGRRPQQQPAPGHQEAGALPGFVSRAAMAAPESRNVAELQVQGRISGEGGEALPGVTVVLKGTSNGSASDADGSYSLTVPDGNGVLVFSFIGFKTQEVPINNRSHINVTLAPDAKALEEVVVIGYGTEKKVNLTGAVSTLNMKQKENMPITNASQALHGVGGVWVNQAGGKPGADVGTIRIRGVGTTNNNNPLVLVDGIEYNMNEINPATIENITVLKDASAAIYGSRAANGVILVTTKAGKVGKTVVNYGFSHGIQQATFLPDVVWDPILYMQQKNQALRNEGKTAVDYSEAQIEEYRQGMSTNPLAYPNRDYFDEMTKSGYLQQHNLRFSGGTEKMTMSLALGYMDQDGIFIANNHANRYSLDFNAALNLTDRLKIGATVKGNYRTFNENAFGTEHFVNRWMRALPIFASFLPDGRYASTVFATPGQNANGNPHMMLKEGSNTTSVQRILTKLSADYRLPLDINYSFNLGIDKLDGLNRYFRPYMISYHPLTEAPNFFNSTPVAVNSSDNNISLSAFQTLSWEKLLAGTHQVSAMVGNSYSNFGNNNYSASVSGYFDNSLTDINAGSINPAVTGQNTEDVLISYFSRVGYSFKEKYLLDGTVRYDGSGRFRAGHRWGLFYGLSAGWRLDQEDFFKDIAALGFIDLLKLRASYGELGNQAVPLYSYLNTVNLGYDYSFNNTIASGAAITRYTDQDISWETTHTYDAGLDFSAWSGRLGFSLDVFKKRTTDILRPVNIPAQVGGLTGPTKNVGTVDNTGFDITLSHRHQIRDFSYEVAGELGYVKNEVVDLNGERIVGARRITTEGYPIDAYYLYEAEGIYQTQDEVDASAKVSNAVKPGYLKFKDQNDDGKINAADRIITGSSIPTYTFSFTFNLGYKGLHLNSFFQGVQGVDLYPTANLATPFNNGAGVTKKWVTDSWTPANPGAPLPILTTATGAPEIYQPSTFFLQDGSYLRLKNLQLKYDLPAALISRVSLGNLSVFVNGENVLTFSSFKDFDPEKDITQDNLYEYPTLKTYSFGINATF